MKFGKILREIRRKILKKFFPEEKLRIKKVVVLIDGENFYNALVDLGQIGIDMGEFIARLTNGKELARPPIYYISVTTEIPEKTLRFFEYLNSQGFRLILKPLSKKEEPKSLIDPWVSDGIYRSAVDEEISTIILVSGDHHFVPAVKFAKEKGKTVKVVSVRHSLSRELKEISNEWLNLKEIIKEIPQKSKIEKRREEAFKALNEGKKIILSTFEESR